MQTIVTLCGRAPTPEAVFRRGYRDALAPDLRPTYRDVQCELPRPLLADFARGWSAAIVARLFGVDLSGEELEAAAVYNGDVPHGVYPYGTTFRTSVNDPITATTAPGVLDRSQAVGGTIGGLLVTRRRW